MLKADHVQPIEYPQPAAGAKPLRTPAMTGQALAGSRVLIVEDDAALALDLVASLGDAGADIAGPMTDLDEAQRLVDGGGCDAVVLDLRVGNHNATSFAHVLLRRRIPFLIYTGYPDSAYLNLDWQGCGILSKPAEARVVIEMLAGMIAWGRQEQ
jgi:DNA-binding NtrC family response regulator